MVCRFQPPLCVEGLPTIFEHIVGPDGFMAGVDYSLRVLLALRDGINQLVEISHSPLTRGHFHAVVRTTIPPLPPGEEATLQLIVRNNYPGLDERDALICNHAII